MTNETDISEVKVKKASPILGILRIVAIVLAVIVFLTTVLTNVMLVYVIFAPDDMPKPFYLMYYNAGETPAAPVAQSGTQTDPQKAVTPKPSDSSGTGIAATGGESPAGSSSIMPGQGILLDTGTKIVNLGGDPAQKKYIRTNVVLEFAPTDPVYFAVEPTAAAAGGEAAAASPKAAFITKYKEEITSRLPVINDIIITLLSNKDFAAVYTTEGKENLRQEIMQAVNSRLKDYHVIYVYFTEFVMQ